MKYDERKRTKSTIMNKRKNNFIYEIQCQRFQNIEFTEFKNPMDGYDISGYINKDKIYL